MWLRVAAPGWREPLDPSYAAQRGGRWNPPGSYATLYLNGNPETARLQVERMLEGSPVRVDDLADDSYVLVAATLPRAQMCADATTPTGLGELGLPETYPRGLDGRLAGQSTCQAIGRRIRENRLRGVWCRSACTTDGRGRELAWFPATARSRARAAWATPLPFGRWRYATEWTDLALPDQTDNGGGQWIVDGGL
jgi:RES domain-containing protein